MQWPRNGPLRLMCRAEDREDLLSSRQEDGEGAADPPPAGHQRFQHARGGRRRATPRLPHDAIRQSRRCNACCRYGRDCPPAVPACPAHGAQSSKARCVIANICTKVKAANRDQQALRGDRICDDDAGQRSQEPLGLNAQFEYAAHANGTIDPAIAALHQLTTEQILHNAIDAKCPSGGSD